MTKRRRTNTAVNQSIGIAGIPPHMLIPMAVILGGAVLVHSFIPGVGLALIVFTSLGIMIVWLLLTWKGNLHFLSKFSAYVLPQWQKQTHRYSNIESSPSSLLTDQLSPSLQPPRRRGQKPLHNTFHLVAVLKLEYKSLSVAALLHQKPSPLSVLLGHQATDWRVVIPFRLSGIHHYQTEEQFEALYTRLERGLQEFPEEYLSLSLRLMNDVVDVGLNAILDEIDNPALQHLAIYEQARQQELCEAGAARKGDLLAFATYSQTGGLLQSEDWVGTVLNAIQLLWKSQIYLLSRGLKFASGELEQHDSTALKTFLHRAYETAYFRWLSYLTNTLGLTAEVLTPEEAWAEAFISLNGRDTPVPPIPHLITVNSQAVTSHLTTTLDIRRVLLSHIPRDHPSSVSIGDRHCVIARLIAPPGGSDSAQRALCLIWQQLSQLTTTCELEVLTQLHRAESTLTRALLQFQQRRAAHAESWAIRKNTPDAAAALNREHSLAAEQAIINGESVIHTALILKVSGPSRQNVQDTLNRLCQLFPYPMMVQPEPHLAATTWLQSLVCLTWLPLCHYGPFDQRTTLLSSAVPLLLPLVRPQGKERR